jgi:hypothetical protein
MELKANQQSRFPKKNWSNQEPKKQNPKFILPTGPDAIVAIPLTEEKAKIIRAFLTAIDVPQYEYEEFKRSSEALSAGIRALVENLKKGN